MESTTNQSNEQSSTSQGPSRRGASGTIGRRARGSQLWLDEFDTILNNNNQQDINQLKAQLREQLNNARMALGDAADSAGTYMRGAVDCAVDCAENYVETRPWQAVGYAAGIAFLLGVIIGRK